MFTKNADNEKAARKNPDQITDEKLKAFILDVDNQYEVTKENIFKLFANTDDIRREYEEILIEAGESKPLIEGPLSKEALKLAMVIFLKIYIGGRMWDKVINNISASDLF